MRAARKRGRAPDGLFHVQSIQQQYASDIIFESQCITEECDVPQIVWLEKIREPRGQHHPHPALRDRDS